MAILLVLSEQHYHQCYCYFNNKNSLRKLANLSVRLMEKSFISVCKNILHRINGWIQYAVVITWTLGFKTMKRSAHLRVVEVVSLPAANRSMMLRRYSSILHHCCACIKLDLARCGLNLCISGTSINGWHCICGSLFKPGESRNRSKDDALLFKRANPANLRMNKLEHSTNGLPRIHTCIQKFF